MADPEFYLTQARTFLRRAENAETLDLKEAHLKMAAKMLEDLLVKIQSTKGAADGHT